MDLRTLLNVRTSFPTTKWPFYGKVTDLVKEIPRIPAWDNCYNGIIHDELQNGKRKP